MVVTTLNLKTLKSSFFTVGLYTSLFTIDTDCRYKNYSKISFPDNYSL